MEAHELVVPLIKTDDNPADFFTKPVSSDKFFISILSLLSYYLIYLIDLIDKIRDILSYLILSLSLIR